MVARFPKIFGNNYIYTLTVTFVLITIIYWTGVMRSPDKKIIGLMIDFDKNMAKMNLTNENIDQELAKRKDIKEVLYSKYYYLTD